MERLSPSVERTAIKRVSFTRIGPRSPIYTQQYVGKINPNFTLFFYVFDVNPVGHGLAPSLASPDASIRPALSAPAKEASVEDPVCDPVGGSSSDSDDETPAEGDAAKALGKSPEDKLVKVGEGS